MHQIEYKPVSGKVSHIPWPKTPRLFKQCTITEKIDGTNAAVQIIPTSDEDPTDPKAVQSVLGSDDVWYDIYAQSRNRLITPQNDNAGFAQWVSDNADHLVETLGPGRHYGEWWGKGIQRNYGLDTKRFSLFNTAKWYDTLSIWGDDRGLAVVPVLFQGEFNTDAVRDALEVLDRYGSVVAPGFMKPEGVIVYHSASNDVFKAFVENDDIPKTVQASIFPIHEEPVEYAA